MATILTLTANPLVDHLTTGRIAANAVNRIGHFSALAGGKGLNMGRVLARHGHRVIATGFAGGPEGELLASLTAADGMEPAFVTTAARTRIGFISIDPEGGGSTSVLEHGTPVTQAEMGSLLQRFRALLTGIDLVLVGGSVPHETCNGLYRQVLDQCAVAGVTCWVDSYGVVMDEALGGANPPALSKPNKQEYGENGRRWLSCRELHLSDGANEVKVRHPEGRFRVIPPSVDVRNPVGSGDCYLAALAHARLTGMALTDQLRYAAAAGAANAARIDIARIAPADIRALVDDVQILPATE
jgi:fructose-1-phosphate kinase PfkB-like protein